MSDSFSTSHYSGPLKLPKREQTQGAKEQHRKFRSRRRKLERAKITLALR